METGNVSDREQQGDRERRPYDRPGVSWEEDFEPYVYSTCGKISGQGGNCRGAMASS